MGFLNKLFGKTAQDAPEHSNTPVADLLTAYAGMALDKQSCLMDVLDAGGSWNVDLNMGELYFDGETGIAIQAIGSFSYESESWLWAWANEASALPEKVLGDAQRLREYGEQHGIAWLLEASFAATTQQLHEIAAAAVGIFDGQAVAALLHIPIHRYLQCHLFIGICAHVAKVAVALHFYAKRRNARRHSRLKVHIFRRPRSFVFHL